jgi:uncharacterized membrane protein
MNLFLNKHNNRIAFRFASCLLAGCVVAGVLGTAVPHFRGWQAVGPACIMLLIIIFVIPYSMRPEKH